MPSSFAQTLTVEGLKEPVEIIKDRWGISHIYAKNEQDLFFAQGYNAAKDRLFQFEIWRRQATGTVAEILGPRELQRDIGTRLFMFRGDMEQEMNYYHPRGKEIITSFVEGINAYIEITEEDADLLPIEFELLGITPQKWTPEVVISRHQGLLMNISRELNIGRAVAQLGPEKVIELSHFHPGQPDITLDPSIEGELLFDDILALYAAFRTPIQFQAEDLIASARPEEGTEKEVNPSPGNDNLASLIQSLEHEHIGSNNWIISGAHTQSGYPIMANDPHRTHAAPSLRYWAHLVAPGWNVIGGGEPAIPGISIGHNEYGAWGLTVFQTDGEDLYVYDTHPDNPSQYQYLGRWEDMRVIRETIQVKGQQDTAVDLKYTRHGPVVYEDRDNHKAYAVRAAWMEIGGAPYLASLRMNQAKNWEEFRKACEYSHIPGENMIWAGRDGEIGWQSVGIAPIRKNWSGLVPVPGDGRYEWDGYLPIRSKPNVYNPEKGFFATANANMIPEGYPHRDAVGWSWSDPFREDRIEEVLSTGRRHTLMDMMQLQTDYLSIPARNLVPLLKNLRSSDKNVEKARHMLLDWDYKLDKNSGAAAIYVYWERQMQMDAARYFIPQGSGEFLGSIALTKLINWLVVPHPDFGEDPVAGRDAFVMQALSDAVSALTERLGENMDEWEYGQYKHALIRHPLSGAVNKDLRQKLDVGPLPRGGNAYTVNNTSWADNQASGASFRIIIDTSDWDLALGMNAPGQGGDPEGPFYRNLFDYWAKDQFFPVYYSRDKIESVAAETLVLNP